MTRGDAEPSHATKGLVRLTMACNERCSFCNVPVEASPCPTPAPEATWAELEAFARTGARTLTISGGEPTLLRSRLVEAIGRARALGVPLVELQTNAVLLDAGYVRELVQAGLTSAFVSLLSDLPELHDRLVALPGAWERCLAGIDALLDAGVRVALNPVFVRATQERVPAYVAFVARRLPRVRSISVSVVQPHGRAADALDALLPDYAVLARGIRAARPLARAAGIELLNPYCGLPLCAGWFEDRERSVEACEAAARNPAGRQPHGLVNTGDKVHLPACLDCAWRTRCGGVWRELAGRAEVRGLAPPERLRLPWDPGPPPPAQRVVACLEGVLGGEALAALAGPEPPARWLWCTALAAGDAARVARAGCTDLALDLAHPRAASRGGRAVLPTTLRELRALLAAGRDDRPQDRLRVHVRLPRRASPALPEPGALWAWLRRAGVDRVVAGA